MGTVILGSGIAGISAGYHLNLAKESVVIYEKNNDWGGLCANFTINGFRFDKFVHFSFAPDEDTANLFNKSSEMFEHIPFSSNYYKGIWLRHPAQNNLAPLSTEEKVEIIDGFVKKKTKSVDEIENYEEWLRVQYGDYFAENFPFKYTRKYWGVEAHELETKWIGQRMYTPDIKQVLRGAFETQEECFYYTTVMKYPKKGGFRSILNNCREGLNIKFNKEAFKIDTSAKKVSFSDGSTTQYDRLISTLPLPEIIKMLKEVPVNVKTAADNLMYTSGYMVSLGFKRPDLGKHLWFYIYDEDIPPARVYSPSLKSPDNVPKGCSALQAEIFFSNKAHIPPAEEVLNNTIEKLIEMGLFTATDLLVKDIRFEKYANVIFDKNIYINRQIILDYLDKIGIESIGRFGRWEYYWSHQAFSDALRVLHSKEKEAKGGKKNA